MDECLRNLIFGLPKSHWSYVYYIEPGLPIFLFNYHDRNLHGIFRATSYGQLEINPHGALVRPRMDCDYSSGRSSDPAADRNRHC
jgi:Development and cell death domain